ncbi:MAG: flotillin-like FloA family protein [Verrucomicrobiota bacterium]|nr:flotillin-like FloA family protein [Verrucomicrobiota bacterium]
MPLTFSEMFMMSLRKTPITKIKKALAKCEAAGLSVTGKELEAHYLCGGNPIVLAEACVIAKELGADTHFDQLAALCLMGRNPQELILESLKDKTIWFDTFSPKREDKIRGFTRDHREVYAAISGVYRISPGAVAMDMTVDSCHLHERLGAAVSVYINTAADVQSLQMKKPADELELLEIAKSSLPGFRSIVIEYK